MFQEKEIKSKESSTEKVINRNNIRGCTCHIFENNKNVIKSIHQVL